MSVCKAIKFRRSIHEFDKTKKISDENLKLILNAGRMAPSGLGSEPTRIIVLRNEKIKTEIVKTAFNELNWNKAITADSLILFVSKKVNTFKSEKFINSRIKRWNLSLEEEKIRINGYQQYLNSLDADVYSANQAFISMSYLSLQVADLGISSNILQGFNVNKLNNILHEKSYINEAEENVSISIAIGYASEKAINNTYPQFRISLDEYAKII